HRDRHSFPTRRSSDLRHLKKEHLVAIYLNTKNYFVKETTLYTGTLNASILHPREVFSEALKYEYGVASVIIAHNHPSNDPTPSRSEEHTSELQSRFDL